MSLSKLLRKWFPKFEPQTLMFGEFGEVSNDKAGCWTLNKPIELCGHSVELFFYMRKGGEPGGLEVERCRRFVEDWPAIWGSVKSAIRRDLFEHVDDSPDDYLEKAYPTTVNLFGFYSDEPDACEVWCQPELFGHTLRVTIQDHVCDGAYLEG